MGNLRGYSFFASIVKNKIITPSEVLLIANTIKCVPGNFSRVDKIIESFECAFAADKISKFTKNIADPSWLSSGSESNHECTEKFVGNHE